MAAPPPPSRSYDLDLTVVSGKHLKNVNWRSGDLKPYAVAYLHPDRRSATKPDDSGSTRPVWNERLSLPLPLPFSPHDPRLLLTLDVFHSKPSETPKPLVGSARIPLRDLIDSDNFLSSADSNRIRTIELNRPSGRPHGKIRIKIAIRERPAPPDPSFQFPPPPSNYPYHYSAPPAGRAAYSPPPPPQPQHIMPSYSHQPIPPHPQYPYSNSTYSNPYSNPTNYYSAPPPNYYTGPPPPVVPAPTPPPVREYYDRPGSAYGGPSAPADYNAPPGGSSYDQRSKSGKFGGVGAGIAVGAVAGALGAMALEEGFKYEEDKIAEKVEGDLNVRDKYSEYRADY